MLQNFRFLITILILAYSPLTNASDEAILKKQPLRPIALKAQGNLIGFQVFDLESSKFNLLPSQRSMFTSACSPRKTYEFVDLSNPYMQPPRQRKKKKKSINFSNRDFTQTETQLNFFLDINKVTGIIKLHLRSCQLHILPESLFKLTKTLEILDLSNNDFSMGLMEVNPLQNLCLFTELKKLYLNNCRINVLPGSLRELKKLSRVELMYNQLEMPKQRILAYFQPNTIVIVGEQGRHLKN